MPDIGIRVIVSGVAESRRNIGAVNSDLNNLSNTITKLSGTSSTLGQSLSRIGSALIGVGRTLTIAVTAPILAAGTAAITAGINFEDAFAGIGKTVDGISTSTGQLTALGERIRNEFRQMALEIPLATNELVELGEVVGQLGVGAEDVTEVTRLIAMLGATTELTGEQAAKGLIRFKNIIGDTSTDIVEFIESAGSAIVALGNASVSTEGEILDLTLRLAAAGDRAHFSAQEVLAWATTLSDLGVRAESGGSAVSRAINEMVLAVQTGSDNLETFASVSGKTVDQFVEDFEVNASDALLHFIGKLEEGIRTGKVTKEMLADLGLSGVRAADILGRLGDAQDIFNKNLDIANKSWAEQIALQEEFNKRAATVKSMIQILKNQFTDLGITIFDLVKYDLVALIQGIGDLIQKFKEIDPETQKTILTLLALAATIGPLLIVIGGLVAGLGLIVGGITALLSPMGLAALAVGALGAALGALIVPGVIADLDNIKNKALEVAKALGFVTVTPADPMAAAAAEHGAPVGGAASPTTSFQLPDFAAITEGLRNLKVPEEFVVALERLEGALSFLAVGRFTDALRTLVPPEVFTTIAELSAALATMGVFVGALFSGIGTAISEALGPSFQSVIDQATETLAAFGLDWDDVWNAIVTGITSTIIIIGGLILGLIGIVLGLINGIIAGVAVMAGFLGSVRDTFVQFVEGIGQIVVGFFTIIGGFLESLSGLINIVAGAITGNIGQINLGISQLAAGLSQMITGVGEVVAGIINVLAASVAFFISSFISGLLSVGAFVFGFLGGLFSTFSGFWTSLTGQSSAALQGIADGFGDLKDIAISRASELVSAVSGFFADLGTSVGNAVGDIVSAVTSAFDDISAVAGDIAGSLGDASGAFDELGGAAGAAAAAVWAAAQAMIAAMQAVLSSITGSPELAIQHPFEDFAKFLDTTKFKVDMGIATQMDSVMEALNGVSSPASSVSNSTNSTNFQFGDITGSQITDENSLASVLNQRLTLLGAS